ncbi:hypothetical protein EK21DRAFT_118685 [Setomelanomma holmii]|uniref:Uncharacterized protein n=1 Tax=Setomelanomma holmii TaxID=210430 RepID=A0A9P4GYK8_9PLEO|nr:hypothetical protein EK21DRAFT_118685 [Setomelanomma holmii]
MRDIAVDAEALLSYDPEQLAHYLEGKDTPNGGFDISQLDGWLTLSTNQRNALGRKLFRAANPNKESLDIAKLVERLAQVTENQDGSPARNLTILPGESDDAIEDSVPRQITYADLEKASHAGLIDDGARPACAFEVLEHILSTPTARLEAVLPWLNESTAANTRDEELKTVFSRQFTQWWDFRKWQWANRGPDFSE